MPFSLPAVPLPVADPSKLSTRPQRSSSGSEGGAYEGYLAPGTTPGTAKARMDDLHAYINTKRVHKQMAEHVGWSASAAATNAGQK